MNHYRLHSRKAFTLVELMIVIAVIGLLVTFVLQIAQDRTPAVDREKSLRIANAIQSLMQGAYMSTYLGKWISSGWLIVFPEITRLTLQTGAITSEYRYASGEIIGTGVSFSAPFFEQDPRYEVIGIRVCDSMGSGSVFFTGGTVVFSRNAVSYTGAVVADTGTTLQIWVQYRSFSRYVIFDRRVGRTEIRVQSFCWN